MNQTNIPSIDKASWWIRFTTAVQFLTRIPVQGAMSGTADFYYATLRRSVLFFPLVGGLIGIFTSTVLIVAAIGFNPWIAALIAISLEATLTGAFHEDAFADTWDALGGGWTREQVLEIMKDSRLGTYGTLGLILGVGLRVAAFSTLLGMSWLWAVVSIVAASTIARIAIIGLMVTTSPISDRDSQAKDVSGTQTWRTLVGSMLMTSLLWGVWIVMEPLLALSSIIAVLVILVWFRSKILKRVGGTTGDLLGCSAYIAQLVILVGSSWTGCHV